jgi:hypothetical protein
MLMLLMRLHKELNCKSSTLAEFFRAENIIIGLPFGYLT